ncbi:MAG: 2'-5' RNA ligase family protein [Reichenbachiella sp.]
MPKKNLYFISIVPEGELLSTVQQLKEDAAARWGSKAALKSPPHITLHMPFQWRDDREEGLVETLSQFKYDGEPFVIELDGFGCFEPRVIYVNALASDALRSLQKQLVTYVRAQFKILNADYKDRGFHPHMTIAFRDLKKSIFPEAKAYYETQELKTAFSCGSFVLLKHDGKRWDVFKTFSLKT